MPDQTLAQDSPLSATASEEPSCPVCAVTVTHGDRRHILRRVLIALLREKAVWKVIVVSNAAPWNVEELAAELGPERIEVLDLKENKGSSAGFRLGIKRACELGAGLVWTLDGDNEPQERTLGKLLDAYARLSNEAAEDNVAVLGFRTRHHGAILANLYRGRRPSSFWGFHVFDIPHKLWLRMPWGRRALRGALPSLVELRDAPFGGLLFHSGVIERHGLPREDFVIYEDDTEFTNRIVRSAGKLRLVPSALVVDLETPWEIVGGFRGAADGLLRDSSDARAYYAARNRTYLSRHCFPNSRLMLWVNRQVYCLALRLRALYSGSIPRYRLLQGAIRDGLKGRLGTRPEYKLW